MNSEIAVVAGLTRTFGKVQALKNASFVCERGRITGFVGPNGAGKTTTMRIMATLDIPDSGNVFIDGHSSLDYPEKVRGVLGYMPDQYGIYSNITVKEYLDFFARSYGLRGRERARSVKSVMGFTDLGGLTHRKASELSKGMTQRLCLARALVNDPEFLILDEPAAGLDPRARIEFRELAQHLASEGKSLLVSSHILTELSEICHSVAIIEQGEIIATGTVKDIYRKLRSHSIAEIRPLGDIEPVMKFLLEQPNIEEAQVAGEWLMIHYTGDDSEQADILSALINEGFHIAEFRSGKTDLEGLFMAVTRGTVQ